MGLRELALYILKYNYSLARHVQQYPEKFDQKTINMYEIRPPHYWATEETFLYLFRYMLDRAVGILSLDNKVLKYSEINEELAGYDESLPQHYVALYFAFRNSIANTVSIYSYKELSTTPQNPFDIGFGNPECKNMRIERQQGVFIRFRYACLYYLFNNVWPSMECFFIFVLLAKKLEFK